jgi:hypothetical protein
MKSAFSKTGTILFVLFIISGCEKNTVTPKKIEKIEYVNTEQFTALTPISNKSLSDPIFIKKRGEISFEYFQVTHDEDVDLQIRVNSKRFEIGPIGYGAPQFPSKYAVQNTDALNKNLIKATGYCGANCAVTYYIDSSTNPTHSLRIYGNTFEKDIDNDRVNEIISTMGTAAQTSIYKIIDDKVMMADLNKTLHLDAVWYDNKSKKFKAQNLGGKVSEWTYFKGTLIEK